MSEEHVDSKVVEAVYQFLTFNGFDSTASSFKVECSARNVKVVHIRRESRPPAVTNNLKKRLFQALDRNEKALFFRIFAEAVQLSEAAAHLKFQAQVYFATAPLRQNPPDKAAFRNEISDFKSYLKDGPGAAMASDAELSPYFALPYVSDPVKHPVFRKLLSKRYVTQFQAQLSRAIHQSGSRWFSSDSDIGEDECKLVAWKQAYDESKQNSSSGDRILYKDYQELQGDYYKIIHIASELIDCLEQSVQGKTVPPELFAEIASRLADSNSEAERRMQRSVMTINKAFLAATQSPHIAQRRNRSLTHRAAANNPQLFRRRAEVFKKAESTGTLISAEPKPRSSPPNEIGYALQLKSISNKSTSTDKTKQFVKQFHFAKVSNQLIKNPGTRSSALLLQALRLQLTKQGNVTDALPVLNMYIEKDVLMLKNYKCSVVASIVSLFEPGLETKEQFARLLNAIASFKTGRDYLLGLSQGREMLYQIALALRTKKLINFAADHTLAALEKLSVRSSVQKELILSGMIEWLLSYLEPSNSDFSLEYGAALLTNLSINSVAQSSIFRYRDRLLNLMIRFVKHGNMQLVSLALNALYVFFMFAKMRSAAKETKLEEILIDRLTRIDSPEVESQLAVVLKVLQGEAEAIRRPSPGGTDTFESEDYLEAEIDSTDTLIPGMTELFGATLIVKRYNTVSQIAPVAVDEVVAPPGTVPRRHVFVPLPPNGNGNPNKSHTNTVVSGRRLIEKRVSGMATSQIPVSTGPDSLGYATDARLNSASSFTTFIADNDKRKPLVGKTGLKAAVTVYKNTKKRHHDPIITTKPQKQHSPIVDTLPEHISKQGKLRHRSESYNEDPYLNSETVNTPILIKSTSTSVIPDLTAPVNERLGGKVLNDANLNSYNAVFESRPKIARTPEHRQK